MALSQATVESRTNSMQANEPNSSTSSTSSTTTTIDRILHIAARSAMAVARKAIEMQQMLAVVGSQLLRLQQHQVEAACRSYGTTNLINTTSRMELASCWLKRPVICLMM